MKKTLLAIVALVALTGCSTYVRTNDPDMGPKPPKGCYTLYEHDTGDNAEYDRYLGVFCPIDEEEVTR